MHKLCNEYNEFRYMQLYVSVSNTEIKMEEKLCLHVELTDKGIIIRTHIRQLWMLGACQYVQHLGTDYGI